MLQPNFMAQRKVLIFIICIIAGMVSSIFMKFEIYKIFLDNLVWLAVAFFAGNALEHVSKIFSKGETK